MYQYPEIKSMRGLYLQANSFLVPDGALEVADNITISKDAVISKRRGIYTYFDPSTGTLNRLFNYQNKLLAAYTTKIGYYTNTGSSPNETGTETLLTGETVAITSPRVSRSLQSNNNFYFTTDNGMLKLTAYNSAINKSGAPQGLDISATFKNGSTSTWFSSGSVVGYRGVFGYQDANGNLILGAPSDIVTINNTETVLANDSGVATVTGAGPYTVTVTSTAHGLTTGQYMTFTEAASGTTPTYTDQPNAEGTYQITVTNANVFTYSIVANTSATPLTKLTYNYAMPVLLEFSVPSEVTSAYTWFYQIYRSSQNAIATGIFSDFKLVDQTNLTSAEYTARVVFYTDDAPDTLLGAELYTNQNSREGELQANFRPPLCDDVALYKNYAIYANATTRQLLSLAVVDPTVMASADYVELKISATTRRYVARTGVGNQLAYGTVTGAVTLTVTYTVGGTATAHGLVAGDTVYISNVTGGTYANQTVTITSTGGGGTTFTFTATGSGSPTSLYFEGVTNGTYPIFKLSTSTSAAVRLRDTAQGLVKAINRDTASLIYAQYTSTDSGVPGQMRFQAKGFGAAIYVRANSTTAGGAFSPVLPDSFASGVQVFSQNDDLPHVFFSSKLNEPEAVPLINFFTVGAKNKEILRVAALRDSLIVVKEDGVFRVTGESPSNFTVTLLDSTVFCVAASSLDVINNQVIFLSNQGVCLVTESTVQIISRKIEDIVQPILGQTNLAMVTGGVAYESERLYMLTTSDPNHTDAVTTLVYNTQTDEWTQWDNLFTQGVIGPNNTLYTISTDNEIKIERKKQTKLDFCDQNYSLTVSSVTADGLTAVIVLPANIVPEQSDIIVKSDVINRIQDEPVFISGTTWSVTFSRASNLVAADSLILYSKITSQIRYSPFHAGLVGRTKQFAQIQIHLRDDSCSRLKMTFLGPFYGGSEEIDWQASDVSGGVVQGWGFFPWGFVPWGQSDGIDLTRGTRPAPIIRTYIPKFQQRGTYIQANLVHSEAAEPLAIQAICYAVRAYAERVSK